ncbi:unnamed protein product [Parnassius mnemosyne]|uniref:Cell surface glycoprotein 1 n=1 Tax=Parnassius mnemosyne TaxID=213953 RepID=A0AAV1L633_9NEOP
MASRVLFVVLFGLVAHASAHVALTYPPARRLDLDFLDNSRTKPPCGMPKGTLKTSFLAGSTFTVHWHLAYAHKGGFSLRILDDLERPVLDLTPRAGGSEFVRDDVTAQKYEVRLPSDFTCHNCTLQLLREAGEWGPTYRFWSCADIDIVQRKDYHETCSGHGFHILGRCKCHKAHSGARCQFADECAEDGECGLRGKCLNINATETPTRMCYCPHGFYGKGCNKKAPWKDKNVDLSLYTKKELSKQFALYWRVVKDSAEVEFIMIVNGTSYAGIGWRPRGLTKQCKNFPVLGPPPDQSTSTQKPEPLPEPEPKAELDKSPEPKSEPESTAEPNAETAPKAEPEPEPTSEPEPEPASEPEPEPSSEPEPEPISEPEPNSKPEPKSEPKTSSKVASNDTMMNDSRNKRVALHSMDGLDFSNLGNDVTVKTSISYKVSSSKGRKKRAAQEPNHTDTSKTQNSPIPEPISTPEPEPSSEPEPTPEPEPTSEPKSEPEPSSEPKSEPESKPEPKSEPEPSPEPKSEPEPSPEPKSEPEPSPKPESEPEPSSEPKSEPEPFPEPKSEPEPSPEPKSEPEPSPEPKSEPEPSPEPTSEPESAPEPESEPEANAEGEVESLLVKGLKEESGYFPDHEYSPKFDFNGMDCTDLVIGTARGNYHRVLDYYTRDRSTPRVDTFWGGHDDVTAASGFEENGVTTIMFRRKIKAKEPTDHSLVDDLMHVIWAHGQEKSPKGDFYRPDELKYHGHGQRGVTTINFFEETKTSSMGGLLPLEGDKCGGQWKLPADCDPKNNTCDYHASWEYLGLKRGKDSIKFTIKTKYSKLWSGIGFSNNKKMSQTDAVIGWVDPRSGRPFVTDAWLSGYSMPKLDSRQDLSKQTVSLEDGYTTITFVRKRDTGDTQDLAFTDTQCLYIMFVTQGGGFDPVNKRMSKHQQVPFVTEERVCIKPCGPEPVEEEETTEAVVSGEVAYTMLIRITGLADSFKPPAAGSKEFEELSNQVVDVLGRELSRTKGYKGLVVNGFMQNETKAIIADLTLRSIDSNSLEESSRSLDSAVPISNSTLEEESDKEKWERIVKDTIIQGRVGNLNVDPLFLSFEPLSLVSTRPVVQEAGVGGWWGWGGAGKLHVVVACVCALLVLAALQAACTLAGARARTNRKEQLIPNNAWKEYRGANTNFAFEPFANEDKSAGTLSTLSRPRKAAARPRSPPPPRPGAAAPPRAPSPPAGAPRRPHHDTRSLQRPAHYASYGLSERDRAAYSLPRGPAGMRGASGARGGRGAREGEGEGGAQPDFYFMPSQRKHEGEIVRVYVPTRD